MSVFGDWINNGSFVCNLSTINFNNSCATVAHAISSNSSQRFHNINVRANHGVSVTSGTTELQGNLFVSTSFLTNNNLKLISNSNGTGSIDSLGAGVTFTGNVTVESMLFGTEGYRLIGSPISNATVEQWDDDFITSGFTGSDYPSYNYNNIFYYDETTPGAFDFGFENVTDISNALAPGRGYYAYIYPDFPYPMSLFPLTVDVTGTISRGSFNFAVTFTDDPGASNILSDGWNILANPYPAAIDWSKNCWTKTNVDDAFYIWDKTLNSGNGDMRSFVNGIGDATQFISSSQGFIVHTNASSPILTASEGCKSTTNPTFLRVAEPENLLIVTLSNVQSGFKDHIYIQANEQATNSFDPDKDALYLTPFSSNVPSLYSKNNDTTKYGIQTFQLDSNYVIPVFITSNNPGQHSLKFDFSSKSNLFRCVTIQDIVTGTVRDILNDTSTYYFTTNNVSEFNRFNIFFYKTFTTETTSPTCYGMEDGIITLDLLNNNSKEIKIRNSSGNIIYNNSTYSSDELIIQNLKAELYTIDILDNSILCSHYSEIITLENPEKLNAKFVPTTNPVDISQGYQTIVFNPSNNSVPHNSEWLMNGVLVSNQEILTHTFQDTGSYTIIHNLSTINCSSSDTLEIKVNKTLIENSVENLNLYLSNDFDVYSNKSTVFISSKYENKTVNISLVDLLGKSIYNEKINLSANGEYPISLNVSEGIYFLNIEENKNIESYKILILK